MTLPAPRDVLAAEARIRPHVQVSPLFPSPGLSRLLGAGVWIKADCISPLSSFKLRGALNHLLAEPAADAAVTSSTGNLFRPETSRALFCGKRGELWDAVR